MLTVVCLVVNLNLFFSTAGILRWIRAAIFCFFVVSFF